MLATQVEMLNVGNTASHYHNGGVPILTPRWAIIMNPGVLGMKDPAVVLHGGVEMLSC